jgi:hypothetical protein
MFVLDVYHVRALSETNVPSPTLVCARRYRGVCPSTLCCRWSWDRDQMTPWKWRSRVFLSSVTAN